MGVLFFVDNGTTPINKFEIYIFNIIPPKRQKIIIIIIFN